MGFAADDDARADVAVAHRVLHRGVHARRRDRECQRDHGPRSPPLDDLAAIAVRRRVMCQRRACEPPRKLHIRRHPRHIVGQDRTKHGRGYALAFRHCRRELRAGTAILASHRCNSCGGQCRNRDVAAVVAEARGSREHPRRPGADIDDLFQVARVVVPLPLECLGHTLEQPSQHDSLPSMSST